MRITALRSNAAANCVQLASLSFHTRPTPAAAQQPAGRLMPDTAEPVQPLSVSTTTTTAQPSLSNISLAIPETTGEAVNHPEAASEASIPEAVAEAAARSGLLATSGALTNATRYLAKPIPGADTKQAMPSTSTSGKDQDHTTVTSAASAATRAERLSQRLAEHLQVDNGLQASAQSHEGASSRASEGSEGAAQADAGNKAGGRRMGPQERPHAADAANADVGATSSGTARLSELSSPFAVPAHILDSATSAQSCISKSNQHAGSLVA